MAYTLRPASAADQRAITALVHKVRINPMGLHWARFIVADAGGQVVACGQLKPHRDSLELASIAVEPDWQGQGLGSAIVRALLERAPAGSLYLTCRRENVPYYARFGFREAPWAALPGSFRVIYVLGGLIGRLAPVKDRVAFMKFTKHGT